MSSEFTPFVAASMREMLLDMLEKHPEIEGVGIRIVQDKGAAIQGKHLDVAVDTHENAEKWNGCGNHRVWVLKEE